MQLEYTDENGSLMSLTDALNLLPYLCEGEVTSSRIIELCREAIEAQIRFYERVIAERKRDLNNEFRKTNSMFTAVSSVNVFDDPICQKAAEAIAKLEQTFHT